MEQNRHFFEIRNLVKSLGGREIISDLDLDIKRGENLVILGGSGEGKSVLLKHLPGLIRPDSGSITVDGLDITGLKDRDLIETRKKIGILFQDGALFDSMTVAENVAFPLVESGFRQRKQIHRRVRETLAMVGLEESLNQMPDRLSGGMRKRVALARAVITEPDCILYDEPTSGLDPIVADHINHLINRLGREINATSVVVTHDLKSMDHISDRVVMLKGGKIHFSGSPEELRQSSDPYINKFVMGKCEASIASESP